MECVVGLEALRDDEASRTIAELTRGHTDNTEYFVDRSARGLVCIAAASCRKPGIVRTSDYMTSEYANPLGGV
jgi:pyruvate, water dikinase